jgi:HlyD family secretion protein
MVKLNKRTIITALVAVIVIAGIVVSVTKDEKIAYETEVASRGAVVHEITVTGSVAPFEKIELQSEVSGKVARVFVTEGGEVKAGDRLIELDASDIAARVASQRAAVDAARARLSELVAGATPQQLALAEAGVAAAESKRNAAIAAREDARVSMDIVLAKADSNLAAKSESFLLDYSSAYTVASDALDRLTLGLFTSDGFLTFSYSSSVHESEAIASRKVAQMELASLGEIVDSVRVAASVSVSASSYSSATARLTAIRSHLEDCRALLTYVIGQDASTVAAYQANVSAALSSVEAALQSLSVDKAAVELQQRLNDAELAAAKSALSSASFAVDAAEKSLGQAQADLAVIKSGSRSEVVAAQRATVAAQEATLAGLVSDLGKRVILAPLDATVTDVAVNVGETAQPGVPAVVLNAKGTFEIVANVSEVDIARVALGQPVDITLDAFPINEVWTGKVAFIEPAEKVVEGVIFYETKFSFDTEDVRIRSGMTANLSIEVARQDDAVRVPIRALKERDGKTYVEVLVNDAPQEREITLGVENNQFVEALSGIVEGDMVIVSSSVEK